MNPNSLTLPIVIVLVAILIVALSIRRLRTLQRTPHGKGRRITERVLLSLVILVCALLAGCTAYNAAALRYYRAIYPPPGKIYSVNGHDMHLYCTGQGSPTIVLESGGGNGMLKWAKVQPELSKTTRVCSYDRAGFGWSTPVPGPRDADTIASELHALLQQAGVGGPYVLMSHSRGGLYIRAYTAHYPEDVAGLIFLETSTPLDEDRSLPSCERQRHTLSMSTTLLLCLLLLACNGRWAHVQRSPASISPTHPVSRNSNAASSSTQYGGNTSARSGMARRRSTLGPMETCQS